MRSTVYCNLILSLALWPAVLAGCGVGADMSQNVPGPAMDAGRGVAGTGASAPFDQGGTSAPHDQGGAYSSNPPVAGTGPATSASCPTAPLCTGLPADVGRRWIAFDSDREAYNRDIYLIRADGTELTRLTTDKTSEREPAFAPDARHLAYASNTSGTFQVYIRDLPNGTSTQLTHSSNGADQPSWSADGKQLVFHSGSAIYIIDADGSNEREIGRGLGDFNAYKYPSLTPDGTQVVFDRNNEIDLLNVDGSGFRYVVQNWTTTEETPAVSPDGFNVAYAVQCATTEQIGVVPLADLAKDPCKVTFATDASSGAARRPAWGPNNMIAYERGDQSGAGPLNISITSGPGSAPCDVTSGTGQNHNPSWAPADFVLPNGVQPL